MTKGTAAKINQGLRIINRTAVIIKPKKLFVEWLNTLPTTDEKVSLKEVREDECDVFLIPDFTFIEQSRRYVDGIYKTIFAIQLENWYLDKKLWPKRRSLRMFHDWFDVEYHSVMFDTIGDPIKRETL